MNNGIIKFPGNFQELSRNFPGNFQVFPGISRKFPGIALGITKKIEFRQRKKNKEKSIEIYR
jgi:hypothetical protein